jgi:MYXO-CTERM domain-containing protein
VTAELDFIDGNGIDCGTSNGTCDLICGGADPDCVPGEGVAAGCAVDAPEGGSATPLVLIALFALGLVASRRRR